MVALEEVTAARAGRAEPVVLAVVMVMAAATVTAAVMATVPATGMETAGG